MFKSENAESYIERGISEVEEYLESEQDSKVETETIMESQVGFPGLNTYRTVEEYESEDGEKVTERLTELRILGVPLTLDYGKVEGDPLEDDELEELVD